MISLADFYTLPPEKSLEVWFPDDVQQDAALIEDLWNAGVCMDDWDYLVIGPPEMLEEIDEKDGEALQRGYGPRDYGVEQLLHGLCDNRWYRVTLRGQAFALGVAYHA